MKRRGFFKTLAAMPAVSALEAQQPGANQSAPGIPVNPTQPIQPPGRAASEDLPKLTISVPDGAADAELKFFAPSQITALRRLSDVLMPGAANAGAPDFLDFLIGRSDSDRQRLYRDGLDSLNAQAGKQFGKAFGDVDDAQAHTLLSPLRQPWTYEEPADPVARFLRQAKLDVRAATMNSREYSAGHRFAGSGLYWYPLD